MNPWLWTSELLKLGNHCCVLHADREPESIKGSFTVINDSTSEGVIVAAKRISGMAGLREFMEASPPALCGRRQGYGLSLVKDA